MIRKYHSITALILTLLLAAANLGQQPGAGAGRTGLPAQSRRPSPSSADAVRTGSSLSGKVLVDGQPLADVRVAISPAGATASLMETMLGKLTIEDTGDDGKFTFDGLRSAAYTLRPMLTGYVVESGVTDPGGQPIYYRPGDFASIKMVKGGVITGRVFAETGPALVGIGVRAVRIKDQQGRNAREVTVETLDALEPFTTDDRGTYRIYGLEPGIYAVCAGGTVTPESSGPFDNDSPVYHPGGPISAALEVTVRAGQESSGIDISYRELAGRSISGTLNGRIPSGTLFSGAAIMLSDASTGALQAIRLGVGLGDAGGRVFSFSGVPDGRYELTAIGGLMGDEITAAAPRKIVVEGSDITGIDLILGPLAEISGRVVLDTPAEAAPRAECAAKPAPHLDQSVIVVRSADNQAARARLGPFFSRPNEAIPNDKDEFKVRLMSGGTYYLQMKLPGDDLYVRSISLSSAGDGRAAKNPADGLDLKIGEKISGVTIMMARGAASISGRVIPPDSDARAADKAQVATSARDKASDKLPVPATSDQNAASKAQSSAAAAKLPDRLQVIAVPAEPEAATDLLRYAGAPVNPDGSFAISNLAPGRYYLLARVMPDEEWTDPGLLPDWFSDDQRKKLHRSAKKEDVIVELGRCAALKDYALHYSPAPPATPKAAAISSK